MALRIQQSLCHTDSRVVLFAGLAHGESPLRLIQPLAYCLAQREETVLLIEIPESNGDVGGVHSDSAGQPLIERRAGVSEFLAGKTDDVASLVFPYGGDGFDCLSSGCATVGSEAMASRRLTNLIVQCRAKYTMILLCGPSTLSSTDLQMLAARSDGIVLTVDRKSATSAWTNEVLGDLLELGAPILGLAEHPKSSAGSCRTRIRP